MHNVRRNISQFEIGSLAITISNENVRIGGAISKTNQREYVLHSAVCEIVYSCFQASLISSELPLCAFPSFNLDENLTFFFLLLFFSFFVNFQWDSNRFIRESNNVESFVLERGLHPIPEKVIMA